MASPLCMTGPLPLQRRARRMGAALGALWLLAAGAPLPAVEAPRPDIPRVLVLHSYNQGYQWTDNQHTGILSALTTDGVELRVEYMHARHYDGPEHLDQLEQLYAWRYRNEGVRFDAILCTDDPALDFLLERRHRLFPAVPVVFCGINELDPDRLSDEPLMTGVNEQISIAETLTLIEQLFPAQEDLPLHSDHLQVIPRPRPGRRQVAVVSDLSHPGRHNIALTRAVAPEFEDRMEFLFLGDMAIDPLLETLATLGPEDAILYLSYLRSPCGQTFTVDQSLALVAGAGPAPTFGCWRFVIGPGALGGKVVSGGAQGAAAAHLVRQILDGIPVEDLPIQMESPNIYTFDYRQLTRFGVPLSRLPEGSEVEYLPDSQWQAYARRITAAVIFILLQTALLVWLFILWTRRQRDQAALAASEARYRALFDATTDAIYAFPLSAEGVPGRFTEVNDVACQSLGYTREQLRTMSLADVDAPESDTDVAPVIEKLRSGQDVLFRQTHVRQDGRRIPMEIHARAFDYSGATFIYATARDISDRLNDEEHRLALERRLQQSQKMESLGVLAGGIAHDFNNLLMAILGNNELAMDEMPRQSPAHSYLEEIEKAAQRAAHLCKLMLAYSGKGHFLLQPIDLRRLAREIAPALDMAIPPQAQVQFDVPDNLPLIEGDIGQIQQALMHLITNASEALGKDGGTITIAMGVVDQPPPANASQPLDDTAPAHGPFVFIQVADSGCGMDADTLGRVFDPFFSTKFIGRGLGMPATLGIVRGHRGAIRLASAPGQGATVTLYFPAMAEPPQEVAAAVETEAPIPQPQPGRRILLVDDEPPIRALTADMLERMGFEALVAASGQEALDLYDAQGDHIDVVLLDLTMPGMNGLATFQALKQRDPHVRILLSSGYDETDVKAQFAGQGLAGFIQKPYTFKALRAMITATLAKDPSPESQRP